MSVMMLRMARSATSTPAAAPRTLAVLTPLGQLRAGRLPRRLVQLYAGLVLFGVSMALQLRSTLGLDPWDVLHSGLARHLGLSFGTVVIIVSFLVLLLWIPLRQMPGLGTISNAVVIGLTTNAVLSVLVTPDSAALRWLLLVSGIALNGFADALYIGSQLGPGPRDGLMTGLVRRTGRSFRLIRFSIEATVLAAGWLLGGTVGVGTLIYAVSIGPIVHLLLPRLIVPLPERAGPERALPQPNRAERCSS
ncbi:MAG TPA: hypothetical protein VFT75_10460 [Nocardioidaceae bacterium]|jgi:uncharacterized membrane protein YczE|nr:hypothetical protein [Nocardioidaceae bacterium]